ncbi:calphotin-like [Helianthus annuus]|uniref:calphotin-like n=1 Tax=Helianthus annuus TaxID=4232 RepID=UPI001652BFAF|nr:calphotin-like [Helianthus annuus]
MEDPVDPVDPVDPIDPAFDFEMAFDDPEHAMAPEPVAALDPVFKHDPVHAGAPVVDPVIADPPIDDHPVDAPLLDGDHVVAADPIDAPFIVDAPVDPVVAPLPDPVPLEPEHALFATHIDPRYAHTQNGWIDADDELPPVPPHTTDARHIDTSFSFPQFTPPARPGGFFGSSLWTCTDTMPSSSDTVSDTVDPMAVVSDNEIPSEGDVYTSHTMSTDDDDFQPFALPDIGVEIQLADGIPAGDLPLAVIPAPVPLAAFPMMDVPLDVVSNDDIDLFEEGPPEDDYEGGAPIDAGAILPIVEAPVEEASLGSPVPNSLESVASASLHDQGVQHHSPDADPDPDMAMSAAPCPSHEFEFDHEVDDDFDPVFPPDFDPDQEIEFIHMDQP